MRLVVAAIVASGLVARIAAANTTDGPKPGPAWLAGPDRAYNCTHYLGPATGYKQPPQVKPGDAMNLVMPADKVMTFKLSAKGKGVTFSLEHGPDGAKLAGATFTWKIPKAGVFDFAVVAIGADGGRTAWPLKVTVATTELFAAWSAGMGSVWPDCDVSQGPRWTAEDLDADGKIDVTYETYAGSDGSMEQHVMLQRGGAMKFTEAASCISCGITSETARDGKHLLVLETNCCCIHTWDVLVLDGDSYRSVKAWQLPSCEGEQNSDGVKIPSESLVFERDGKHRITGVTIAGTHPEKLQWRDGGFR